ncbi:MAG: gamma-glutamyltransferase family protein, partial [Thermoanaerobaculia bacterium]
GVPGSPAGLHELHRRFGRLPWPEVVAPAIRLAQQGFLVSARTHRALADKRDDLAHFPETAAVWLADGEVPATGTTLRLPNLAATLRGYAERGPEAITRGPVAAAVEQASRRHGGVLTAADLAVYRPVWREPLRFRAFGWEFASMGLPSSGGIILGQSLAMLERLAWQERPRFGADRAHLLAEVLRRSFADRFLLGDPATTAADADDLLDRDWLARHGDSIDPAHATPSDEIGPREPARTEAAATTHLSVADAEGNLVALTTTLNGLFGCKLYVPAAGFFLNNEMDDFTTTPGRPNQFGLIQGEANSVAPGKRMLSSMTPTLTWRGREAIALGGRGGSRIPTAVLQTFLAFALDGDDLQAAVARPRIHHQWWPDEIRIEADALSPETLTRLTAMGHTVRPTTENAKVNAVRLTPSGTFEAAADPRGPAVPGVVDPQL